MDIITKAYISRNTQKKSKVSLKLNKQHMLGCVY